MSFMPARGVTGLEGARQRLDSHHGKIVRDFAPMRSFFFDYPFGIVWDVNGLDPSTTQSGSGFTNTILKRTSAQS